MEQSKTLKINLNKVLELANQNETKLIPASPVGKFRPPTIFHLQRDEEGEIIQPRRLDTKLYQQEYKNFGHSKYYSFNRAAPHNRSLYGEIVRQDEVDKFVNHESWLFIMHLFGHLDFATLSAFTPRKIDHYAKLGYTIKAHAVNDFMLYLSQNPSQESKDNMLAMLENRISYLLGKDIGDSSANSRTEYSVESMQAKVNRIKNLLEIKKEIKYKTKVEKLMDYLSLVIQEAMLLVVSLKYIAELLPENQDIMGKLKIYATKLSRFIQANNLDIFYIKSPIDEGFYKLKNLLPINKDRLFIPVNLATYSTVMDGTQNAIKDPRHYTDEQLQSMYCSTNMPTTKLRSTLRSFLSEKKSPDEAMKILSNQILTDFNDLAS